MTSKKFELKITASFRPNVRKLSNTGGKDKRYADSMWGMCEEGDVHRTGKSFLERQITCG